MTNKQVLRLEKVSKDFIQGSTCIEVLKNIDLSVNKGEIVSIVGYSGSGKSTLLQIAGLLDSKYEGDVTLEGEATKALNDFQKRELRLNKIGFVYQYHHLLRDFSARENIAMPALIAGKSYIEALDEADQYLDNLDMYNRRFNFPGQLSGGEQQRVAIARALFNKPSVILADEPTGNLDSENSDIVFNVFMKLAIDSETAIVMVTHNLELAKRTHKIYHLERGSLS